MPDRDTFFSRLCVAGGTGITIDFSCMEELPETLPARLPDALGAMARLEGGAIANADEGQRVGHYWLRDAERAPEPAVSEEIVGAVNSVKNFAQHVLSGEVRPQKSDGFFVVLWIGIGGSSLGPQLLADALGDVGAPVMFMFLDNTDPDGIDRIFSELDDNIASTLCVVVSKSGSTRETINGMVEARHRFELAGLDFARHSVAITCRGSILDKLAETEGWLARFPLWGFVGGRYSVFSPVGLLPLALLGEDVDAFLGGAKCCDTLGRCSVEGDAVRNPAACLAMWWYAAVKDRGKRNMVMLPYRDRLGLLARYMQQLIMESLGKELDRAGRVVHEGITVLGNKGSTDQHALVQQLREGPDDFFGTLIGVRRSMAETAAGQVFVRDEVTSGDYLQGFLHGTRDALSSAGREIITIMLDELSPRTLGALIALFERSVGLYAELVDINAYHQPGVEAGKRSAEDNLALQVEVERYLLAHPGMHEVDSVASGLGHGDRVSAVYYMLAYLAAVGRSGIVAEGGADPKTARYGVAAG